MLRGLSVGIVVVVCFCQVLSGYASHGNTPETATLVSTNGTKVNGCIQPAGDVDFFKFNTIANDMYRIETFNDQIDPNFDTHIILYGPDGTTILAEDTQSGSEPNASKINYAIRTADTYYVRVSHYLSTQTCCYSVSVTNTGPAPLDDHSDDPVYATVVATDGTPTSGVFEVARDVDAFGYDANAGSFYLIETANIVGQLNTLMRLLDGDGYTELAYDISDGLTFGAARIIMRADLSTRYYALLSALPDSETGSYTISVTELPAPAPITPNGQPVLGSLPTRGAVRLYALNASLGHDYRIKLDTPNVVNTFRVRVLGTDGRSVLVTNTGDAEWSWICHAAGTYYLEVREDYQAGEYELSVTDTGVSACPTGHPCPDYMHTPTPIPGTRDHTNEKIHTPGQPITQNPLRLFGGDHGSGTDTATLLHTNGTLVSGELSPAGDIDWFKFDALAGSLYTIQTQNLAGGCDTFIILYDTDGSTELAMDDQSGDEPYASKIEWACSAGSTYYVTVEHFWSSGTGTYNIFVQDEGAFQNDHGNDAQSATLVTTDGTPTNGTFELVDDQDWFAFDLVGGHHYVLDVNNLALGADPTVRLIAPDGATVLLEDDQNGTQINATRLQFRAPSSARYYGQVLNLSGQSGGTYQFKATGLNTGTPLALTGSPQTGSVTAGSCRAYTFPAVLGHIYDASVTSDNSQAFLRLVLVGADGLTPLVGANSTVSSLAQVCHEAGTYSLFVREDKTSVDYSLISNDSGVAVCTPSPTCAAYFHTATPTPFGENPTPTNTPTNTPTHTPGAGDPTPTVCLGDADKNGFVNGEDFRAVRDYFGMQTCSVGDANGDCFVNTDDFRAVRDYFGASCW